MTISIVPTMKKTFLIALLPLFSATLVVNLSAQSQQHKIQRESPCGVSVPTFDEFMEERNLGWRVAAASKEAMYFYNTRGIKCDANGILKVWIKGTYDAGKSIATMSRYELRCRANQLRISSQTEYNRDGTVATSRSYKNPEWDEAIPDSVGERVLQTVCHKSL